MAGYVKARWPEALGGKIYYREQPGNTLQLQKTLAIIVAFGCILLGVVKLYWAVGGTIGIDPILMHYRDLWWHLLSLSVGVWSLAGAYGILVLTYRRGFKRFLLPMALTWISSGMLFTNNLYSALSATRSEALPSPEYPVVLMLSTQAGIVLGVIMGMLLLLVLHDRRLALRGNVDDIG